jgi:hypothetical protein
MLGHPLSLGYPYRSTITSRSGNAAFNDVAFCTTVTFQGDSLPDEKDCYCTLCLSFLLDFDGCVSSTALGFHTNESYYPEMQFCADNAAMCRVEAKIPLEADHAETLDSFFFDRLLSLVLVCAIATKLAPLLVEELLLQWCMFRFKRLQMAYSNSYKHLLDRNQVQFSICTMHCLLLILHSH